MKITVDRNLQINVSPQVEPVYADTTTQLTVIGKLLGAFDGSRIFDKSEATNCLKAHIHDLSKLLRFMRIVIGKCYVVIASPVEINIICSPSSPGFFYTYAKDGLLISNDEAYIYQYANLEDLSDMEVLNIILSHHAVRSPFTSIFESVKRVIAGQIFRIGRDLSLRQELYIKREATELDTAEQVHDHEENYNQFISNLEATAQVIERNWDGDDKYLLLSGGIDSAVLLTSLLRAGSRIQPLHWPKHPAPQSMAEAICNMLGVELESYSYGCPHPLETELDRLKSCYESGLGMGAHWNNGILNQLSYFETKGVKSPLVISGQNMDSLYAIDTYAADPWAITPRFLIETGRTFPHRLRYTDAFLESIAGNGPLWLKVLPIAVSEQFKSRTFYDYLLSLILPVYEHVVPLINEELLPRQLSELTEAYVEFRKSRVLIPLIGSPDAIKALKEGMDLSVPYMNHLIRMLKWVRFVQAVPLNYLNYGRFGNHIRMNPASEGPLSNFFATFQLRVKDAFSVKRFCYRYFQEELGQSYRSVASDVMDKYRPPLLISAYRKAARHLGKQFPRPPVAAKEVANLFWMFRQLVDPQDSILLPRIQNDVIKDYLATLYQKIYSENYPQFKKSEIMQLERLVNLEVFLRGLCRDPK
jgi:hypothetical protein